MLSFADVEAGRFDPARVRGKIVVVGATSARGDDQLATSTSGHGLMSRAEVEAASIDTALRGFPLHKPAGWVDALLALLVAAVAPLVALRARILVAFAAGVLALVAISSLAQFAFAHETVLTIVPAIMGAAVGLLGSAVVSRPTESPAVNRVLDRLARAGGSHRTRRVRALLLLVAAFSVVSVTLLADASKLLRNLDYSTVDMRFSLRGEKPAPTNVVMVALDDQTLNSDPKPTYPLGRDWYAARCRNLTKAGARSIAIDVQFIGGQREQEERRRAGRGAARRAQRDPVDHRVRRGRQDGADRVRQGPRLHRRPRPRSRW